MDAFLLNISSFPTSVFTIALGVVIGYWLIAFLGIIDFDILDLSSDLNVDGDISNIGGVAGLMMTLGLTGVPITVVLSFIVLSSWVICYLLSSFVPVFPEIISILQLLLSIGIIVISFSLSLPVTAQIIKPLKPLFKKINQLPNSISLIGVRGRVRSSRVDNSFGEVECLVDGASLIIKVRSQGEQKFKTNEIVVLIEHQGNDSFLVVSEEEFLEQLK